MTFSLSKKVASQRFSPIRFRAARLRRGLSIGRLAELIGIERHAVSRYEAGRFVPTREHLHLAAKTLGFPPGFFFGDERGDIFPEAVFFRYGYALPASVRSMAVGAAMVAVALDQQLTCFLSLPAVQLPSVANKSPEQAANLLRRRWSADQFPVARLLPLLEANGVRIFSLPPDCITADSFSFWLGTTPFILLNTSRCSGRQRFDLAHELGHIVLHQQGAVGDAACREAADFAAAFLMPVEEMKRLKPLPDSFEELNFSADQLGVSALDLARRFYALGMLTDRKFRRLRLDVEHIQIGAAPADGATSEVSDLFKSIFATLRARRVTKHRFATELCIYPKDIETLTFGISALEPDQLQTTRLKPNLKIV